jgi:hypothetical protein
MKDYFPADYCPQQEKVLDLSRSVLTGNRNYARSRRHNGRYAEKVERQTSRDQLRRAATWLCTCFGDVDVDCSRCYADDLPTVSETRTSCDVPIRRREHTFYDGPADHLAQLFRWYGERVKEMDHYETESFLREKFLSRTMGHSVKTRHAYDHLIFELQMYRINNYNDRPRYLLPSFVIEQQACEATSEAA